jgi:hypothetical protein
MTAKKPADPAKARLEARTREILDQTAAFCTQHLNAEYAQLCEWLVLKMSRKRAVPYAAGSTAIWAGAVIYALGQINFLFDRKQTPHVTPAQIAAHFGTTTTTLGQKAKAIRGLFKMGYWDPEFGTRAMAASNPLAQMVMVDGMIVPVSILPELLGGNRSGKG